MELRTKIHTIFMMIGPTECGKTTFAQDVLIPQLRFEDIHKNAKFNIQYISSDAIRQEVLGSDYDKYDQVMLEASSQAFHLLFEKLKMVTSFPINAEFIVLDTTGLADDFRAKVREIASENKYNVEVILFDYRKREDYYASERSKKIITNHINRFKKDVLGSLSREGYSNIHKIRAKDFYSTVCPNDSSPYKVIIENRDDYLHTILPQNLKYIMVGDVHECLNDLQGLLLSYGYQIESGRLIATDQVRDTKVILVGDWIDKGQQTRETIEFLYVNQEHFLFVLGNHENFVHKYIKGEVSGVEQELLHTYFDSTQVLLHDADLMDKFCQLVNLSQPFYKFCGVNGPSFYVTHAPCKNKYIGKLDTSSLRHQRNFRVDRNVPFEEQLQFLKQEAVKNHPYHVYGHIAAKTAFRIKNKIHLDTGSVHGNALTSVKISFKPFFKAYKSKQVIIAESLQDLFVEQGKITIQDLDVDEVRRLQYCSRNKVNFISGTMPPADKDEATYQLESLTSGLNYYAARSVNKVVLQPKYMGSRCNIYLHNERQRCFAVSRNGYKINQVELTAIYDQLQLKFGGYMQDNRIEMLIIDGELLPWKALGDALIKRQFKPIESALESEFEFLKQYSFQQEFDHLADQYQASGFEQDQFHIPKAKLSEKYGDNIYQNYKHVHSILETYVPLHEHEKAYITYKRQLELYAEDDTLEFKPFALLKIIYESGEEQIPDWTTSDMYQFLSEDEYLTVDLTESDSYERAEHYFASLTMLNHMEGVVIKPEVNNGDAAPFMKVRNPDYLSIIYGYDYRFPHKYHKLFKQKNIKQKLRTSINEHRLGKKMLSFKFEDIKPDNREYQEVVSNLLFEVAKEKEIDPRL
ncbi:metallophosphoesterase [Paenibacillus sp. UMB4589-SE434]|uniref:metallophosphoesterase n=1 Tax=Paenibacillus sp. UMB4589-SE434 TaxID=3046314 RepID=UPI00254B609A|nr:metallophosphoesterase [Paenibacillus sp. UMB4589-SE434]MDK8182047.1 metallophosphoesterase [Paenibacillus sp. UMB4589-SE434]